VYTRSWAHRPALWRDISLVVTSTEKADEDSNSTQFSPVCLKHTYPSIIARANSRHVGTEQHHWSGGGLGVYSERGKLVSCARLTRLRFRQSFRTKNRWSSSFLLLVVCVGLLTVGAFAMYGVFFCKVLVQHASQFTDEYRMCFLILLSFSHF